MGMSGVGHDTVHVEQDSAKDASTNDHRRVFGGRRAPDSHGTSTAAPVTRSAAKSSSARFAPLSG